jgi:hypothetical protein
VFEVKFVGMSAKRRTVEDEDVAWELFLDSDLKDELMSRQVTVTMTKMRHNEMMHSGLTVHSLNMVHL